MAPRSQPDLVRDLITQPPGAWVTGTLIPAVLTDTVLAAGLDLSLTVFYARKNAGHFTFLELKPQLPHSNTRYSGALVRRWIDGDDLTISARRFFGTAGAHPLIPVTGTQRRRPGRPRTSAVHASQSAVTAGAALLKEVERRGE